MMATLSRKLVIDLLYKIGLEKSATDLILSLQSAQAANTVPLPHHSNTYLKLFDEVSMSFEALFDNKGIINKELNGTPNSQSSYFN